MLVAGEVALSLVLIAGAGLLLRSFLAVRGQDPGFTVADVWTVPLSIADPGTADEYRRIMDGILRDVRQIPGVESASYGLTAPLQYIGGSHCCWRTSLELPGHEEDPRLNPMTLAVTEDYFSTLGVRIVAGRAWSRAGAGADPTPVVINRTLAAELEGADASVGLTGTLGKLTVIVVGVAGDTRHYGLDQKVEPMLYLPMERLPFSIDRGDIIARVDPAVGASIPGALRRAVWAAEPGVPVPTVRSLREAVHQATAGRRFESLIFGTFGSVSLLLAAGGLYGTLLYVAGQRRREMGIRLALGASRGRIEAQMLRVGVALGVVGVLLGLGGTWAFDKYLQSRLWGVGRADPWALGGAAALLFLTAVLASWLPARRAGRVDPLETLRVE